MKSLLSTFIFGLLLLTVFSSCQKEPPVSSIGYEGFLFVGEQIDFKSANSVADVFKWNFGDGNLSTSVDENTSNVYTVAGNYTVTLTITNDNGSHTSTLDIVVKPLPNKVKITKVTLNNFDTQTDWDASDQTGADIYFRVGSFNGPSHDPSDPTSTTKGNVSSSSLPIIWSLSQPMELDYSTYKSSVISFYDADLFSNAFMGDILFKLSEQIPFTSNTIDLIENTDNLDVTLEVEYIY